MKKICAGIVTFNPDINLLKRNILSIKNQVSKVFIFDNFSQNARQIQLLSENYNCRVILCKENKGIAYALNKLCEAAKKEGFRWILTLDQDSVSPPGIIDSLSKIDNEKVAVIGPNIIYKENEAYVDKSIHGKKEVDWIITSGSLTNLSIWEQLDGFDNNMFIDGVDRDYCLRAKRENYKIIKDYDVCIIHRLGNLKCRKFFGRTIYVTNHSESRKYYMVRNSIYLWKKLKLKNPYKYILKIIIKTLLFEENVMPKLKAIIKGIRDGFAISPR